MPQKACIFSLGRRGGSVRYATSVIDELDFPYEVFVSSFCIEKRPHKNITVPTYRNNVEFLISSLFILPFLWLYLFIGLCTKKYSVLYLPYTHYWNFIFILTFKLFNVKTISTIHDGIPHSGDDYYWLYKTNCFAIRKSDHLIFLTEFVRQKVSTNIGFSAKSSVIPHGLFSYDGVQIKNNPISTKPKLLFLGRICYYKGLDLLIQAVESLSPDSFEHLIIAGENSHHLLQVHQHPKVIWDNKWLTDTEIATHINSADILILPYREATQSGVISIGIHSEKPMVCTNVGGLPEQLSDEACVFVEPNAQAIKEGIQALMENSNLYHTVQVNLNKIKQQLTWSRISSDIKKTFL